VSENVTKDKKRKKVNTSAVGGGMGISTNFSCIVPVNPLPPVAVVVVVMG
jgi:hypothetical protein